jgi:NADPH:quinone reductase-like Zn-dependent oxidoreductase
MRALKVSEQITIQELTVADVADPVPNRGELLIRLKAAALNHRDLHFFNRPVDRPVIIGSDGSGVVEGLGEEVTGWSLGDEVIIYPSLDWGIREDAFSNEFTILGGPRDGTFAEKIAIPVTNVYRKPAHLSFEEAAALPLAGLTAHRALFSRAGVETGERLLIHGIGGGVALFALQFAKVRGAKVMVTSRHDDKLEQAYSLGADYGVNSSDLDWVKAARDWSEGKGVHDGVYDGVRDGIDVVVESIGGEYLSKSLEALRLGGRLVTFGRSLSTTATIDIGLTFWNHLSIIGSTMGSPADFAGMLELVNTNMIKPVVDSVRSLDEGRDAFQRMADGQQFGKLVLTCD